MPERTRCLGMTYWLEWFSLWRQDQTLEQALDLAQKAVALDESLPYAHACWALSICGKNSTSKLRLKWSEPLPSIPTMLLAIRGCRLFSIV